MKHSLLLTTSSKYLELIKLLSATISQNTNAISHWLESSSLKPQITHLSLYLLIMVSVMRKIPLDMYIV